MVYSEQLPDAAPTETKFRATDAMRRFKIKIIPTGQQTLFELCDCASLAAMLAVVDVILRNESGGPMHVTMESYYVD